MHSNAMSPALCYDFCTSKAQRLRQPAESQLPVTARARMQGMDIFALVEETECRCGISAANRSLAIVCPLLFPLL